MRELKLLYDRILHLLEYGVPVEEVFYLRMLVLKAQEKVRMLKNQKDTETYRILMQSS